MRKLRLSHFSSFLSQRHSPRWFCSGLVLAIALTGLSSTSHAQAKKAVVETKTLMTADGWSIPITYYQSDMGKEAAVVLLLHGEGENQLVWEKNGLAKRLQAENFAVVTCDLRKHGEAKNPRANGGGKGLNAIDYKAMCARNKVSELEVIQDFLFEEHQEERLNMAKYAIVASDNMATIALNWAAIDWTKKPFDDAPTLSAKTPRGQTVRGLILLSPSEDVPGVSSAPPLRFFRMLRGNPVAMLFVNGSKDGTARDVRNMVKQVKSPSNSKVIYTESFTTSLKGSDLIGRVPKAEPLTVGLLKKHVQDLDVDWKDRRSRAER